MQLAKEIASAPEGMVRDYKKLIDDGFAAPFGEAMQLEKQAAGKQNAEVKAGDVAGRLDGVFKRGRAQKL